jgi:hypothetical protein
MKYHLFAVLFLSLMANVACWQFAVAPTPQPIRSIFDYDTCAPPCWMGLIPGISTSAEVEEVLNNLESPFNGWTSNYYNNVIDAESGVIVDGAYYFFPERYSQSATDSLISITNGIVDAIFILPPERIHPQQVVEALGLPDDVQLIRAQLYYLELAYTNELIRVRFIARNCSLNSLNEDFVVDLALYFSPEKAIELVETDFGMQPQILAYHFSSELGRQVPIELFQSWLDGEGQGFCDMAVDELSPVPQLPPLPSMLNSAITVEPQATSTAP